LSHLSLVWRGYASAEKVLIEKNQEIQKHLDATLDQKNLPEFHWAYAAIFGWVGALVVGFWVYWPERKQTYSKARKAESRWAYLFLTPWLIGLLVFSSGPMIFSLLMSLADWDLIQSAKWVGIRNYVEAFTLDGRFWTSLRVTFTYVLLAVPFGVLMALALATLLNMKVRGIALYRTCFYLPSIASIVVTCLVWRKVFQTEGGLLNTLIYGEDGRGNFLGLASLLQPLSFEGRPVDWLGNQQTALISLVIMSLWSVGSSMVILLGGLQQIPRMYYESSLLDGANGWQRFRKITLPMLSPSILFCVITGIIACFQVFTKAYVMTGGGPGDATRFYMLYLYEQAFGQLRMGYASSLAWILFLIILGFVVLKIRMSRWVYYEAEVR
jgi:multiple sugar transport system permease protein